MKGRVLVTGASGALGPSVVSALSHRGYAVRTFSLDSAPEGTFSPGAEALIGDITNAGAVAEAVRGMDHIVHLAALLHLDEPSPALERKYRRINVEGTRSLVLAGLRENVGRLIHFSTIAVYGAGKGRILSEDTVPSPDSLYAWTKAEAESIVLAAKRPDGAGLGTVLRLGAVYGSRVKGNYFRLVRALAKNRFVPVGNGENRRTLVHDRDAASAVLAALENPIAAGRLYNVTDGRWHTMKEIVATISRLLGRRTPRISIPAGLAGVIAAGAERTAKALKVRPILTRSTIDKYTEDLAVDGSRIQSELGFAPAYDLARGWAETIEEMRRTGVLS